MGRLFVKTASGKRAQSQTLAFPFFRINCAEGLRVRACVPTAQIHATARDGMAGVAACVRGRRSETARNVERLWMMEPSREYCQQDHDLVGKGGASEHGPQERASGLELAAGPHCRHDNDVAGLGRRRAEEMGAGCIPVLCVRSGLHLLCRYAHVCARACAKRRARRPRQQSTPLRQGTRARARTHSALKLPRGSEVLMSALNIPDVPAILEHHGLVCVPVDLDIGVCLCLRLCLRLCPRMRVHVRAATTERDESNQSPWT